jgi:hypothetical protein
LTWIRERIRGKERARGWSESGQTGGSMRPEHDSNV